MFSATDAAFSGFREGRENFRTLLIWIPILGVLSLAMVVLMIVFAGPGLVALQTQPPATGSDPKAALEALKPIGILYAVIIPCGLLFYGILYAAVNRMMLRPSDRKLAWIAFGADELRQIAVMILLGLLFFLVYLVGAVAVGVLAAVSAAAWGTGMATLIGIVAGCVLLALFVMMAVRLSLASAQTFATGRINIFGSWKLTKGHVWPMLGAYLLAFILAIIAYIAVYAILLLVVIIVGGGFGAASGIFSPDMTSLQTYFTPMVLVYQLLAMIPAPFLMLIMLCPAPSIYRGLVGASGPASTFD